MASATRHRDDDDYDHYNDEHDSRSCKPDTDSHPVNSFRRRALRVADTRTVVVSVADQYLQSTDKRYIFSRREA